MDSISKPTLLITDSYNFLNNQNKKRRNRDGKLLGLRFFKYNFHAMFFMSRMFLKNCILGVLDKIQPTHKHNLNLILNLNFNHFLPDPLNERSTIMQDV